MYFSFAREVVCVPAFLNVTDVMIGTRRQLEMALQNVISNAKMIFWDSGLESFSVG